MVHRRGLLLAFLISGILIVFSAFTVSLFMRPGILLVVDARYREAYGPSRADRALLRARLALWRPVEELLLDDNARPDMISALVASRPERPRLVVFGYWLSSYAQALGESPDAPPILILGGDEPDPAIASMVVDRQNAYREIAKDLKSTLDTSTGPVLLVADEPRATVLMTFFREQETFVEHAERLVLFDPASGPAQDIPSAIILAGGRLSSWPDAWNGVPLAFETILPPRQLPASIFALVDSSIYIALPHLARFKPENPPHSYSSRIIKP